MWHASQEIVQIKPNGSVIEFRARLSGLEEITRWVLSWGSKAQVLGLLELKKRVKKELMAMTNTHS
jgi:predicted DNA-binding transcriptional regulator YafY